MRRRVLIVGGVAGGASCAARLRRLDENADIVLLDRGPYVSFANCGLPYFVGDVIPQESSLLVATPALFRDRFRIEVRTRNEVTRIDRVNCQVEIRDLEHDRVYTEPYDNLLLSPGASPFRPPLPGLALDGIFSVRTIPDSRRIRQRIEDRPGGRVVVVGGGFIGLEMAENLVRRGMQVTVLEMLPQVMPPMDPEMAISVADELVKNGVQLILGDGVAGFEPGLKVLTRSGRSLETDMVILALGVRPEVQLARDAGLEIGDRGGIRVDEQMRTSDSRIWAVGDAIEVRDIVTGEHVCLALAGPAQRQGRIAAESMCGREVAFRGVHGTAVVGVFGLTAAFTGASEKTLRRLGMQDFQAVYLHPGHHAGYYPGARPIHLKLLFRPSDGLVLGAQAVGEADVEKRIDVISTVIQKGGSVFDLEEAELCYAPQYGAAKDPVNLAGMIAANCVEGDLRLASWSELDHSQDVLLDVREPSEFESGHLPGAVNIPLGQIRTRLDEVSRDAETTVYCGVGQRAYYAVRILSQQGFRVSNLSGGYRTYQDWIRANPPASKVTVG